MKNIILIPAILALSACASLPPIPEKPPVMVWFGVGYGCPERTPIEEHLKGIDICESIIFCMPDTTEDPVFYGSPTDHSIDTSGAYWRIK